MAANFVVAVTDRNWFESLSLRPERDEVNFWSPSDSTFRALVPGELFLFKLHAPISKIVGGGVFTHATGMPLHLAWETFGESNGSSSAEEMLSRISQYRRLESPIAAASNIECRILAQPFFFRRENWLDEPPDWSPNIVRFKTYSTDTPVGSVLWNQVKDALIVEGQVDYVDPSNRFGKPQLIAPRLGQRAFRTQVIDAYRRRCAVTGERTLPALEASHIRPFSIGGTHDTSNGILLRKDLHSLFDRGFVTISPEYRFDVCRSIRESYRDDSEYNELHGCRVKVPQLADQRPDPSALDWHNNNVFQR